MNDENRKAPQGTEYRNYNREINQRRQAVAGNSSRRRRRRRKRKIINALKIIFFILIIIGLIFLAVLGIKKLINIFGDESGDSHVSTEKSYDGDNGGSIEELMTTEEETTASPDDIARELISEADIMAMQYDYDGAIDLLRSAGTEISECELASSAIARYQSEKDACVAYDMTQITHIFFHTLCVDPSIAFDPAQQGQSMANGYNSLMTTIPEFEKTIQEMYDRGYVLISLRDMAYEDENGNWIKNQLMLPEGKKAFVMSEDDVCYYEYMEGAGFSDMMVVDENGKPTNRYTDSAGNVSFGEYDIVPILDRFIEEHPDFSYHGHKACLVFTGYNGILGYRTDETYLPENYVEHKVEGGHDVEAERKEAVKVLKALLADGYDLGSHSWGHRDMGEMSVEYLKKDTDRWEKNVGTLIEEASGKKADILIYPKGADIGDWRGYTDSANAKAGCLDKFNYLYENGFRYFCNVDASQYWLQYGDSYLRTGRRPIDGYALWKVISGTKPELLSDLIDANEVFDSNRPTPVPAY